MDELTFADLGEGVVAITLNRPEKRNALTVDMRREFVRLLRGDAVRGARALLLLAEGPVFSAGADLKDPAGMDPRNVSLVSDLLLELRRCPPVVVSAVQGPALGLGAGIALTADMVFATPEAGFGYPEIQHGLVATMTAVSLIDYLGKRKAFEMLIMGERMSAAESLERGLVNRIVPAAELKEMVTALARRIAGFDHNAVATAKRFFYEATEVPFSGGMRSAERVSELMRAYKRLKPSAPKV